MDYEIWYGSVMMSAHQQCPANDSIYTETLSVDCEGEYEMTRVGRTSAGLGPSYQEVSTEIPLVFRHQNVYQWNYSNQQVKGRARIHN